jgi:hypothetical protein
MVVPTCRREKLISLLRSKDRGPLEKFSKPVLVVERGVQA